MGRAASAHRHPEMSDRQPTGEHLLSRLTRAERCRHDYTTRDLATSRGVTTRVAHRQMEAYVRPTTCRGQRRFAAVVREVGLPELA